MDQSITTAIAQLKISAKEQQQLSAAAQLQVSNLRENFQSFKDFAIAFNPQTQVEFGCDERKSIMADYSTLATLDLALGEHSSSNWLTIAITDLNIFSGSKSMTDDQIEDLADFLATEYKDVKFSMMQLFFYRFKRGDFGRFYGKVDPMVITCALKDFVDECARKRDDYLTEEYETRQQEERDFREDVYRKWYEFEGEFFKLIAAVDKEVLSSIFIDKIYYEDKCILLAVTRDQYDLLEGIYISPYAQVFKKYFPDITIKYRLLKALTNEELKKAVESHKALMTINEKNVAISSARAVVDNTFQLDKNGLAMLRDVFRKRYGCFPDEYLKQHEEHTKRKNVQM